MLISLLSVFVRDAYMYFKRKDWFYRPPLSLVRTFSNLSSKVSMCEGVMVRAGRMRTELSPQPPTKTPLFAMRPTIESLRKVIRLDDLVGQKPNFS